MDEVTQDDIDEMEQLRAEMGPTIKARSPQERLDALRATASEFADETNQFMLAPVAPGSEALETQVAAVSGIIEILLQLLIADIEMKMEEKDHG